MWRPMRGRPAGSRTIRLIARAHVPTLEDLGWPRLMTAVTNHTSVSEIPTLAGHASAAVEAGQKPSEVLSFSVRRDYADVQPGDWVDLKWQSWFMPEPRWWHLKALQVSRLGGRLDQGVDKGRVLMDYRPIPGQSPVSDAIKDLRRSARQDADTTAVSCTTPRTRWLGRSRICRRPLDSCSDNLSRIFRVSSTGRIRNRLRAPAIGCGSISIPNTISGRHSQPRPPGVSADTYALLMLNNGSTTKLAGVAVSPEILEHNGVSDQQYTGGGDVVSAPAVGRGPQLQGVNMGLIQVPGAMSWNYFLEPNRKYRVRLRRAIMGSTAPDTSWGGVLRFLLNVRFDRNVRDLMVEINRGPGVVGWNTASNLPQGVVSPSEHRLGISALALYEGIFMDSADSGGCVHVHVLA